MGVTKALGLIALVMVLLRALASCIIADPPAAPPSPPVEAPEIVQKSVTPPLPILTAWPASFVVPVLLPVPTTSITWGLYVDYGSTTAGNRGLVNSDTQGGSTTYNAIVPIEFSACAPAAGCHVVSFFVQTGGGGSGLPGVANGDVAQWLYDPTGLGACTGFDGGAFVDGATPPMMTMDGVAPPSHLDGAE